MKPEQTGHEPCGCGSDQLREKLPSTGEIQSVADAMRQLGDSSRLRIFWVLCHCEECVMGLSALVEMSSPAVSHHLRPLKSAGHRQPAAGQGDVLPGSGYRSSPGAAPYN